MYYHVAMLNGRANQLSEMVPVDRIYSEFGRYIKAGATQYVLLNTSDIRAVSMTAKAVMDTAWGGLPRQGGAMGTYAGWASQPVRRQGGGRGGQGVGRAISRPFPSCRPATTMATRSITPKRGRC